MNYLNGDSRTQERYKPSCYCYNDDVIAGIRTIAWNSLEIETQTYKVWQISSRGIQISIVASDSTCHSADGAFALTYVKL